MSTAIGSLKRSPIQAIRKFHAASLHRPHKWKPVNQRDPAVGT